MKKITALIDEKLLQDVQDITQGKNITECIVIALSDFVKRKKLRKILDEVKKDTSLFQDFDYEKIRKINREVS